MSEQEEMDSFNGEASTSVIDIHMSYIQLHIANRKQTEQCDGVL